MHDVEQEVLISVFRNLDRFRFQSSFNTYLYTITRNKAIDHLRKIKREAQKIGRIKQNILPLAESAWEPALDTVIRQNNLAQGMAFINSLPETEKSIFQLRFIEELSYIQIAKIMKLPLGTIKSKIFRTKQLIAERLVEKNTAAPNKLGRQNESDG